LRKLATDLTAGPPAGIPVENRVKALELNLALDSMMAAGANPPQ